MLLPIQSILKGVARVRLSTPVTAVMLYLMLAGGTLLLKTVADCTLPVQFFPAAGKGHWVNMMQSKSTKHRQVLNVSGHALAAFAKYLPVQFQPATVAAKVALRPAGSTSVAFGVTPFRYIGSTGGADKRVTQSP